MFILTHNETISHGLITVSVWGHRETGSMLESKYSWQWEPPALHILHNLSTIISTCVTVLTPKSHSRNLWELPLVLRDTPFGSLRLVLTEQVPLCFHALVPCRVLHIVEMFTGSMTPMGTIRFEIRKFL